ncbi:YjbH domain-containing protein [Candidatus Marinimicrobia bacterium]|nr:YjbH domain-containing protein [Candidatus Neomarinimicrobiota bacterium]
MKLFNFSIIISILSTFGVSQTYPPPTTLVSVPSAGTLVRGSYAMQMRVQKNGGLTSSLSVGITDRFQFGLSFGSANLIGDDSLEWYPRPEANLKYRLIDETTSMPGLSLGLDTQGQGKFNEADTLMRYDVKAMGIYVASSKNWVTPLGNLGLHMGTNYNFAEVNDGDKDINYFFGIDMEFNPELSILLEYNAALNENDMTAKTMSISKGGYLNAAIRWTFVERLHIEMDFNNLLFDNDKVDYFNRELKITYIEYF